jgi:uncharacterized protein YajQ (UPF0234 family)
MTNTEIRTLNNTELFDICFDVPYLQSVDKENYKQALKLIDTFIPYNDGELLHEAQCLCEDVVVWGDIAKVKFQKLFKKSDKRYIQAVYLDEKIRKSNEDALNVISYIEDVLGIPYDEIVCSRCRSNLVDIATAKLTTGRYYRQPMHVKESFKHCRKALVDLLKKKGIKITKDTHPDEIELSTEEVNDLLHQFYSALYKNAKIIRDAWEKAEQEEAEEAGKAKSE